MGMLAANWLQAAPVVFQSTAHQTSLLELYTSEGCSSCPPTEAWMNGLKDSPGLWRDFVPVAFHVDYWNNLGWTDRWSKEDFSDRQRGYAQAWSAANIYTPELVLNGAEWSRHFWQRQVPVAGGTDNGVLSVSSDDGIHWQVNYTASGASTGPARVFFLHTALLVSGVSSEVTAGENAGRRLDHDFVVLALNEQPLVSKTNEFRAAFLLDEKLRPQKGRLALAAWITPNHVIEPVQATGGWLGKPWN